jgi:hypothetical protein
MGSEAVRCPGCKKQIPMNEIKVNLGSEFVEEIDQKMMN